MTDAFQRKFPHLKRGWVSRKLFLLRYDWGMMISRLKTRWHLWLRYTTGGDAP